MNASEHYRTLKKNLENSNCFEKRSSYIFKFLLVTSVYLISYILLLSESVIWIHFVAVFTLGFVTVQAGFLAHDAGDGAVTRNRIMTFLLPHLYMTFLSGLSFNYFIELHKLHHRTMTKGSVINAKPVNVYEFKAVKKLVAFNPTLFMIATIFLRGFTLKIEGIKYLQKNGIKHIDIIFLLGHLIFWIVIPSFIVSFSSALINYLLVTLLSGIYTGIVLIVNHAGMASSIDSKSLPFIERVGSKTRNLSSNWISDIIWGGINNHIEHHLYPTIPSSNLAKARVIVKNYFLRNNLPYNESTFFAAIKDARNYFISISVEDRISEPLN